MCVPELCGRAQHAQLVAAVGVAFEVAGQEHLLGVRGPEPPMLVDPPNLVTA
jgi:hypothetical protein